MIYYSENGYDFGKTSFIRWLDKNNEFGTKHMIHNENEVFLSVLLPAWLLQWITCIWVGFSRTGIVPVLCHFKKCKKALWRHLIL